MELTLDQALQKGIEAHKAGQVQEADKFYTAILQSQPKHPDANHNMGVLAAGIGKAQEALPFFKTAVESNPSIIQFWLSYIDALIKLDQISDATAVFNQAQDKGIKSEVFSQLEHKINELGENVSDTGVEDSGASEKKLNILDALTLGQPTELAKKKLKNGFSEEVKGLYEDILARFSKNKNATNGIKDISDVPSGAASKSQYPTPEQLQPLINLYDQGQLQQVLGQAADMLEEFPRSLTLHNICGASHAGLGKFDAAIESYKQALKIKPDYAAYFNMGIALKDKGELDAAIESYKQALRIKPDYAAYFNMGIALKDKGELDAAIESYKQALKIKPDFAEAYNNIGIALQAKGELDGAIESYKQALKINPDYADAYSNMGLALKNKGELDVAIESYKQALKINPDYAAYFNMGIALKDKGELDAAIESYKQAIKIKPDFADGYNNMGNALKNKGELDVAIESYKQALKINPDYAEVYNNMGITLQAKGEVGAALENYKQALKINPDYAEAYNNMGIALTLTVFTKPIPDLQEIITSLLNRKNNVRPRDISSAAISLLKFEPVIKKLSKQYSAGELKRPLQETISELSELPLLLKLMSVCPIADLELEVILTDIRYSLLSSISKISASPKYLHFQSALALQCFTNEYIYNQTDKEAEELEALKISVKGKLSSGKQPSPQSILCLASYKALHNYDWTDLLVMTTDIEDVFTRQILEPRQDDSLKAEIPILEEMIDKISCKVRKQYEENPYPRWVDLGLRLKPVAISKRVVELQLKLFDNRISHIEYPHILVAGCGTGQHSIGTATTFKNSKVFAIDLSLASLAYAKRKTEELGIQNIDYMQADILDLGKLDRQFDIIESVGVLHHMDDPMSGWKVLTGCLKPGGLMRIGLYSELAREHIVKLRDEINQSGFGSSEAAMKLFRRDVINSDKERHKSMQKHADFYSMSSFRDLLFHVQEHRFTLPQIQDSLSQLGLEFCGFEAHKIVQDFKRANTGPNDPYDLDKWHSYEEANPKILAGMYVFWCQKLA